MKECKEIMRELFAKRHQEFAWPFYRPVDTRVFKDYRSIVKRPMDMGTVRSKLAAGEYDDPGRSKTHHQSNVFGKAYVKQVPNSFLTSS